MRTDKFRVVAMMVALALLAGVPALAQVSFQGKVVSSKETAINAPFGGLVDEIAVSKGQPIHVGDAVATIRTTKVFAEMDGIVSGIFAREGDQAEGITKRYGAVMFIEPVNRYVVSATTEKAYNSSDTRFIHLGERVHLACTKDGTHVGTAVVTGVGGETGGESSGSGSGEGASGSSANYTSYSLEVTSGEFYIGETVAIYRDSAHSANQRIGRGTVQQNKAVGVEGTGSVLKLHVQVGDQVERGEILFETVEGVLDGLYPIDNTIYSTMDGIVANVDAAQGAAVEKNGKLVTVYPEDALQIQITISELDLNEIHEGDKVSIEFEWDMDGTRQVEGTVYRISHVGEEQTDKTSDAQYLAYINFTPDETVRLGMTVNVYTTDGGEDEPFREADMVISDEMDLPENN